MLVSFAREYISRGFAVMPVRADKTPVTRHGSKDATKNPALLDALFASQDVAGIGIATGGVSGGLVVIDSDDRAGGDESLVALEKYLDGLPDGPRVKTPGGCHVYMLAPPGVTIRNRVNIPGLPGIDVRGEGGYVVGPPSRLLNGEYTWEFELGEHPLPTIPPALLDIVQVRRNETVTGTGWDLHTGTFELPEEIGEGSRNDTLTRFAGQLRRAGLSAEMIFKLLCYVNHEHCASPLDTNEIKNIARSAGTWAPGDQTGVDPKSVADSDDAIPDFFMVSDVRSEWEGIDNAGIHSTGLETIDSYLSGGLRDGQVYVLTGPPGSGKTSLVGQISRHFSSHRPVMIWTLEMTPAQLAARMAGQETGDHYGDILLDPEVRARNIDHIPANVTYYAGRDPEMAVRAIKRTRGVFGKPPLVVLDYVQKLGSGDEIRQAVSDASDLVRRISRDLSVPVLVVSAASRAGANTLAKARSLPPESLMGVSRESSGIEYDASTVITIGLDPNEADDDDALDSPRTGILSVAKSRWGIQGHVEIAFYGRSGRWEDRGRANRKDDLATQRLLVHLRVNPGPYTSVNEMVKGVQGTRQHLLRAARAMVHSGDILYASGVYMFAGSKGKSGS